MVPSAGTPRGKESLSTLRTWGGQARFLQVTTAKTKADPAKPPSLKLPVLFLQLWGSFRPVFLKVGRGQAIKLKLMQGRLLDENYLFLKSHCTDYTEFTMYIERYLSTAFGGGVITFKRN